MHNQVRELESSEDSELLASAREGNDAAFGELYRRHVGAGRAAARSLTRSSVDAEDAVSEAFARVLAVMRRGGGPEIALRPYLMTVVRNVCYDRASARSRELLPGETEVMAAIDDHPTYQSADLDQFTESNLVNQAFASLSDRWKQVLWQTDIEGRSPRDLAEELQLAPTAVAALAFRAREGLADAYLAAHVQHRPTAQCNRDPSELARYVRNRMRSKEQLTFGAHLAQCHRCMEAVEELRVVSLPLRSLQWPAFFGTPFIVYGGKVIGVIRRVVTAQVLTTAGAAAVTVATVTVVDRVPFEPFDALRPKAYVGALAAPSHSDAAAIAATGGSASDQGGGSAVSASVPDALGLPVSDTTDGSAAAGAAADAAVPTSATPTTALISPALPTDTTVNPSPVTSGSSGTDTPDTTAPEVTGGHEPAHDTGTSGADASTTSGADAAEPTSTTVTLPTPVVVPPSVTVIQVVGGTETQSSHPADDESTPPATTTSTTAANPATTLLNAPTTSSSEPSSDK